MSNCRSCGAAIDWVKMISGKNMPVDQEPVRRIIVDSVDGKRIGRIVPVYVSHFETCPNADQHRKRRA